MGEVIELSSPVSLARVDDPQGCLAEGKARTPGFHTVFANMDEGDCAWTLLISFTVEPEGYVFVPVSKLVDADRAEPVDLTSILTGHISEIFERSYAEPRSPLCTLSIPDTLLGGWANLGRPEHMDDTGLRGAGGMLHTAIGVPFRTLAGQAPNCAFLSWFYPDQRSTSVRLRGRAQGIYFLIAGSTLPQCSRMENARITVEYADGSVAVLPLRNPENWWPIEQDYLIDDYMFVDTAPLPPRVDLRTGRDEDTGYGGLQGKA